MAHAPDLAGPLNSEGWTQFIATFSEAFPTFGSPWRTRSPRGTWSRHAFSSTEHTGEFQGIPPTNKQVAFSEIMLDRIVDAKVAEHWLEFDQLGLLQQLGVAPGEPEE